MVSKLILVVDVADAGCAVRGVVAVAVDGDGGGTPTPSKGGRVGTSIICNVGVLLRVGISMMWRTYE